MIIKKDKKFGNCLSTSIGSPKEDSSSPILFSIQKKYSKTCLLILMEKKIKYADDVDFVTEEEIDIEEICNTLKKYNLIVNKNKTELQ